MWKLFAAEHEKKINKNVKKQQRGYERSKDGEKQKQRRRGKHASRETLGDRERERDNKDKMKKSGMGKERKENVNAPGRKVIHQRWIIRNVGDVFRLPAVKHEKKM